MDSTAADPASTADISFAALTDEYLAWLRSYPPIVEEDLVAKAKKLAESPFVFLRGTFYRWAERLLRTPECRPHLLTAPIVIGVGDAHVENFGTWTLDSGKVNFSVNDFDE